MPTISSPIILDGMGFSIDRDGACLLNNNNVDSSEYRLMHILASGDLALNNITLSGGCADGALFARIGGAILNAGNLSLNNSTISGNESTLDGGGIYNSGTISIIKNSTFSENSTEEGGGIYNNGLITTIQNSTFSGNSSIVGGGISNRATINAIQNSTFSGNYALSSGGGIYNDSSITVLSNSLFHKNTGGGTECSNFGTTFNGNNNLSDVASSGCPGVSTTLITSTVGLSLIHI